MDASLIHAPVICVGCGTPFPFDPARPNKRRCKSGCGRQRDKRPPNPNRSRKQEAWHRARAQQRENHELEFIGVDGEGVDVWDYVETYPDPPEYIEVWNDDIDQFEMIRTPPDWPVEPLLRQVKGHDYVLLSVGNKSLHKNGQRLGWRDIFPFLWEQFLEHPNAVFVGYFLGYDFTHWLRDLPEERAWRLLHKEGIATRERPKVDGRGMPPWPVRCGGWEFDMLGEKRFKLRPYVKNPPTRIVTHKDGTQEEVVERPPWMYICDTGQFFQSSFLRAIDPKTWNAPILTPEEYGVIETGKLRRADAAFDTELIRYNVLENDVLSRLMETVNEGFVGDNIRLNRTQWFGPGQASQKWLGLVGAPTGEEIRAVVPKYARDAARATYFGGWFEIFRHGPQPGPMYGYDINSAYPYVISTLPCLMHGQWTRGTGKLTALPRGALRMVNATVRGNDPRCGAMLHRDKKGCILRPRRTAGWYWWHELQAAKRAKVVSRITVHEWIKYQPCKCEPPLAEIRELYQGRLTVGKNTPSGKSKKLTYNSAYGKMAQSIGEPKFANAVYASLITAGCRTMILDAIATHPTRTLDLAMVATDGVYFRTPHPTLEIHDEKLGAWDLTVHQNMSLFMPGLYWDDQTRARIAAGESPKLKSRGVSAGDLCRFVDEIDRQWREVVDHSWEAKRAECYPKVNVHITFAMVSAKLAITRNDWPSCARVMHDVIRTLNGDIRQKREGLVIDVNGSLYSIPYTDAAEPRSYPYDKSFGDDEFGAFDEIAKMTNPDGPIDMHIAHAIRPGA